MSETENCISCYFHENSTSSSNQTSPYKIKPKTKDTSFQDSSLDSNETSTEEISLSQLSMEEQILLKVEAFFNITPRNMPVSPHYVIEEEFSQNPWAMLIATIFLSKTSGKIARPFMQEFFESYPTPYHVLEDKPSSLERFFIYIGLRKRALIIWKLSYQYVSAKWRRASDLCGIGKYGEDAYRIFCLGHTDLDPDDRYLKLYLNWLQGFTDFEEENSSVDSECVLEDPINKYYTLSLRVA